MRVEREPRTLAAALRTPAAQVDLYWLGQAGFALKRGDTLVLIDPYLSDALAKKYSGTALPHHRLMPAPIDVGDLPRVDWVLITHGHGDHMDRDTLPQIAARWVDCRFVVPAAETETARALGLPIHRIDPMDAGQALALGTMVVHAVPAAHETHDLDEQGHDRCLGYVLQMDGVTLYHSGDCVPYAGLADSLARFTIDLALLPVNGRDAYRAQMNVPGNFTLDEAVDLCAQRHVPTMIAHHFGMFSFNTVDPQEIEKRAALSGTDLLLLPAALNTRYVLSSKVREARK